jgi:spore maturation protein CgeB
MKIALISDELTRDALSFEADIKNITPLNYKFVLKFFKPDILFVESAWHGYKNSWKFKIASYPQHPKRTNNKLKKVVKYAKKNSIPTVFWNKEDGIHFDRFIQSAKLFEHVFTVDETSIPKYKALLDSKTTINTLMFAIQQKFHFFDGFHFKYNYANFVGSYSKHIHPKRRIWQDMMFETALKEDIRVDVYDRNSNRKSINYRYPTLENINVHNSLKYKKTAKVYKDYLISLNVNTIENSPTMFSRRLLEIIACGGVAITNPTPAIDRYFKDFCYIVSNEKEISELFNRLKNEGLSSGDYERLEAGAKYVLKNHTWTHRLEEIKKVVGLS